MKQVQGLFPFDQIKRGTNVRIDESHEHLIPSIADHGLETPIWVTDKGHLIRGYLRHAAISEVRNTYPEKFAEFFGDGVPAIIVSDATEKEIAGLHVDHGNVKQLQSFMELYLAAEMLFASNYTEAEVANHLAGLLDVMKPIKTDRRQELNELKAKDADEYFKEYAKYRRGIVQQLKQLYNCPPIVKNVLIYQETGRWVVGDEVAENKRPKLTWGDVRKLSERLAEDQATDPKHGKRNPGPKFWEEWNKLIKRTKEQAGAAPREKAMSAREILDASKNLNSTGMKLLAQVHAGKKDVSGLEEADEVLFLVELIKENDPDFWEEVEARGRELEAEALAKAQEQAEAEAAVAQVEDLNELTVEQLKQLPEYETLENPPHKKAELVKVLTEARRTVNAGA